MAAARHRVDRLRAAFERAYLPFLGAIVIAGLAFGAEVDDPRDSNVARVLTVAAVAAVAVAGYVQSRVTARLGRAEWRFSRVLEHVPVVAYVADTNASASALYVSPQITEILGYPEEDWLGDPELFMKILHPDDRDRVIAEHEHTIATHEPLNTTYRLIARCGEPVWFEDHGVIVGVRGRRTMQGFLFNVTKQRLTLEALRESEERYRVIVESAGDGIWTADPHGTTTFVNERLAEMLLSTREEIVGRPIFDFMFEEDRTRARAGFERRIRLGISEQFPFRLARKDGGELHVLLTSNPLHSASGESTGALAVLTDMTAHRATETKFRAVFEAGVGAKLLWDDERRVIDVNRAATELTGRAREELLTLRVEDVFATTGERVEAARRALLSDGRQEGEFVLARPDGTHVVEYHAEANIQPGVHLTVLRDVTVARAAEHELRTLGSIVSQAPDGVIYTDVAGIVQNWNAAAERIYGYTREDTIGREIVALVVPQDEEYVQQELMQRLATGEVIDGYETHAVRKDGARIDVSLTLCPLRNRDGDVTGIGCIIRDITERKRLEERLRLAQRMESIGQLAGGVAHDFNNSLMAIRGYASLMLAKLDDDDPRRRHAEGILKAADGAASTTRQLLAFGRKQMLQPRVFDVSEVVVEMHGLLEHLIGEDIELTFERESTGHVRADPSQLEQVIVNLAVNARDAMPNGGRLTIRTDDVDIQATRHHRAFAVPRGSYVRVRVADTGMGMPPEVRDRIFDPFFSTKSIGKGTGLGLSMVYGIVKQSGGYIEVTSEPGVGTTFEILLPASDAALHAREPRVDGEDHHSDRGEAILLVEDEAVLREVVGEMLTELGYSVISAANGSDAIELLKDDDVEVDALLTDVVMPGMSGTELAMRANLVRPGTKLLYMSGYTDEKLLHHGARNANVAFLQKPFTAEELGKKLQEVLMSRSGAAERSMV